MMCDKSDIESNDNKIRFNNCGYSNDLLPFEDDINILSDNNQTGNVMMKMTLNINDSTGFVLTTTTTTSPTPCTMTKSLSNVPNYFISNHSSSSSDLNSDGDSGNVVINGKVVDLRSERYAVLTYEQVDRLDQVMDQVWPIVGRGNFPTLDVRLKDLVQVVRSKLQSENVDVRDIRLNGGAASHVLAPENSAYNDIDLIFGVDLSNSKNFDKVRAAVLDSLLEFLPDSTIKKRISSCSLKEAYVHKMVKVTEGDRWSLISLSVCGRNVELKFVDMMKRQFEFSVDSFQIILDSLIQFYECSSSMKMSENCYPTVVGESVYGDFREALYHLQKKLIATRNPEEIRGGGLLKYCNLLVHNYVANKPDEIKTLERYMCSRFFIDFSDLSQQRAKLESYLHNHFADEEHMKYHYLVKLSNVVNNSTVCLMGHERRQTLNLIDELAYYQQYQDQQRYMKHHHYEVNHQYIYGHGNCYYHANYYTQYMPTHTNCYTCHCGAAGGWMACMSA